MLNRMSRVQRFRAAGRGAVLTGLPLRKVVTYGSYYVLPIAAAVGMDFAMKVLDPLMMNPPTNWF